MNDPNADLLGYRFPTEDAGCVTVTGTVAWDVSYVEVRNALTGNTTIRNAATLRRSKYLRQGGTA